MAAGSQVRRVAWERAGGSRHHDGWLTQPLMEKRSWSLSHSSALHSQPDSALPFSSFSHCFNSYLFNMTDSLLCFSSYSLTKLASAQYDFKNGTDVMVRGTYMTSNFHKVSPPIDVKIFKQFQLEFVICMIFSKFCRGMYSKFLSVFILNYMQLLC